VVDGGLVLLVNLQPLAVVAGNADILESQEAADPLTADGVEQGFGAEGLAALESGFDQAPGCAVEDFHLGNRLDLFAQPQGDAPLAHEVVEGVADFAVEEAEHLPATFDQGHLDPQGGHDASVLGANDAATHDDHALGQVIEPQQFVAGEDRAVVEWDIIGPGGASPHGNQKAVGGQVFLFVVVGHDHFVGPGEPGSPPNQFHAVAIELVADEVPLVPHDGLRHGHQVGHGDVTFDGGRRAEHPLLLGADQMEHCFAEGLRGDGPRVDLRAPEDGVLLDDGHLLAELGGLDRPLLTRGAGANHNAVVMLGGHGSHGFEGGKGVKLA
jgi:hypothetical protein